MGTEMERPSIPGYSKKYNFHKSVGMGTSNYLEIEAMKELIYFFLCTMEILLTKNNSISLEFMAIGYVVTCNLCILSSGPVAVRPNAKLKCEVLCLKIITNFKMMTTEH